MKAIRIHKNGEADVVVIDDIPLPEPTNSEVRVQIKATSLNHLDIWVRQGMPGMGAFPLTLGCDGSGVVDQCGANVRGFEKGDPVFIYPLLSCGDCRFCCQGRTHMCPQFKILGEHINGTHCEYFCIDANNLVKLHPSISFEEGAAFPLTFLTAWQMLVDKARVCEGDTVLVMGGASGVGSAAVQIAKLHGAQVIATVGSQDKADRVKQLGADFVLNHYQESLSKRVKEFTKNKGADLIFEHVGARVWDECLKCLAWGGRLVTCGATTGHQVSMNLRHFFIKQQTIMGSTMGTRDNVLQVHDLIAQKKLKPSIAKIFAYPEVKAAYEYLERSQHFGKVVLSW